ncbi:CLUMA_CG004336, isoform A [Clunio marinus]|uniref:CLUMA_CG004336, isoform A n=1 Tax=Clunio marinus TaxID=568069 RepID=A0A1J1HSW2_9DIPT|nr:CLUMA_CG004336, isoform A [Clunio marinus]
MSIIKTTDEQTQHQGDVTSITFHDGRLYSAGGDGKIKIWDVNLNFIRDVIIHEAYIYAIAVDKVGKLYSSSCDGSIKCVKKPLESDDHDVILQHENEIEAVFVDDKLWFYCGDDKGGVTAFEDGKLKFTLNIVECVKSLYVENNLYYTLLNHDLSIHEVRGENGKFVMKGSIPGKFPVTLFGEKTAGRSKYFAILTRDGKGITIAKNGVDEKFEKLAVKENLHEMIVNAMVGFGEFLFSADYAGKVVRSKVEGNQLTTLESFNTGSGCANCLAIIDDKTIFVGSTDGSIKKIHYN